MRKVLIVDDVPLNILLVKKMLTGMECEFLTAANGEQAMQIIRDDDPDIVLLDLLMPIVDGFKVLEEVRSGNCGRKDMPIVILSALNGSAITRAMDLGANDYITKPIIMKHLLEVIEKIFAEK